jgi:hypothetical protein
MFLKNIKPPCLCHQQNIDIKEYETQQKNGLKRSGAGREGGEEEREREREKKSRVQKKTAKNYPVAVIKNFLTLSEQDDIKRFKINQKRLKCSKIFKRILIVLTVTKSRYL